MWRLLVRSGGFSRFVEFMRSDRGKALDKRLVRWCNFSLLMLAFSARGGFAYIPVLLLHTVGRKSGEARSAVMPYFMIDGTVYLIGSNGAKLRDPAWVGNLKADPEAKIRKDWKDIDVRARFLDGDSAECDRVWSHARLHTPQYDIYQSKTDRKIPVVALEPVTMQR